MKFKKDHRHIDVRECIWRARLRQSDVARLLEISPQQLNDWCTKRKKPSKIWGRMLKNLFVEHGVELAYLD